MTDTATDIEPICDRIEIQRFLDILSGPGEVRELRFLEARDRDGRVHRCVAGFYNEQAPMVRACESASSLCKGVYITLNPVPPHLAANDVRGANPVNNRAKSPAPAGFGATDAEMERRTWFLVDVDPRRPAGIGATDEEHAAAIERTQRVAEWLGNQGWPAPVLVDSGNGAHALFQIDLPNTDEARDLLQGCLQAIGAEWTDGAAEVDLKVYNASRIARVPGTMNCKGPNTPDRPHRLARILAEPKHLVAIPRELLEELARRAPSQCRQEQPAATPPRAIVVYDERGRLLERARKYLLEMGPAVAGQHGDDKTIRAARVLVGDYALSEDDAMALFREWNEINVPPWTEGDLQSKVSSALRHPRGAHGSKAQPSLPAPRPNGNGSGRITLQDRSPQPPAPEVALESQPASPKEWDAPTPLPARDLPSFPVESLPSPVKEYVAAVTEALQVPPDLVALMALPVIAVTCQRRVRIEVAPGYEEPTNIFTMPIMPPAERKSAVASEVTIPLDEWEEDARRMEGPRIAEAAAMHLTMEERLSELRRGAAREKDIDKRFALEQELKEHAREFEAHHVPPMPRLRADDCTPEKAKSLIFEHGGRLAVIAAEPVILEHMGGKYSKDGKSNLGVFLAGHAGDTLLVDRGNRTEAVSRPALTMGVCAQEEALRDRFLSKEFQGRGVIGRFALSLPAPRAGTRTVDSLPVPTDLRAKWRGLIRRLLDLPYGDEVRILHLGAECAIPWREWRTRAEHRLLPGEDLFEIKDWGGKWPGLVARIAALLHMAEHAPQPAPQPNPQPDPWNIPVGLGTLRNAIAIGEYLVPHARAVYALGGADERVNRARHLLARLRRDGRPSWTKRELHRSVQGRLIPDSTALGDALRILGDHGWVRMEECESGPKGGRPSEEVLLHPNYVKSPDRTDRTPVRGGTEEVLSVLSGVSVGTNMTQPSPDGETEGVL